MKQQWTWGLVFLFVLTRLFIWVEKPEEFTQIIAVYMPYAHLWASGVKPYLEQWYEYPPLTIPLFYLPHLIDQATLPFAWHINYAIAYRGMILAIDTFLFAIIWRYLLRTHVKSNVIIGSLVFYILATTKAHHFIYDAMDLVFAGFITLGLVSSLEKHHLRFWLSYFAATAIKLINAPLGLAYALLERQRFKQSILLALIAGLLVWFVPLALYRSSLSVMLVYHQERDLQVESVPAQIAALINVFTQTETYAMQYQSFAITGPISHLVKTFYSWVFLIYIGMFVIWSSWIAYHTIPDKRQKMYIALTISYLLGFLFFGKVLSTPFHLWLLPIITLYPFSRLRTQLSFTLPLLIIISLSMTPIKNIPIGPLNTHLIIGLTRSLLLGYLWIASIMLVQAARRKS